jgi:hypothetical protein
LKTKVYIGLTIVAFIFLAAIGAVGLMVYFSAAAEPEVIVTPTRTEAERVGTVQAQFTATAQAQPPTPTVIVALPTRARETPTPSNAMATFDSPQLGFTFEYPAGWYKQETDQFVLLSPAEASLAPGNYSALAIRFGHNAEISNPPELGTLLLAELPAEAETMRESTLILDSLSWNATQKRFADPETRRPVIANLAVTEKDGQSYYLMATAPEAEWEELRPLFQIVLNSFRFRGE